MDDRGLAIHREGAATQLRRVGGGDAAARRRAGAAGGWARRHVLAVLEDDPEPEHVIVGGNGRAASLALAGTGSRGVDAHVLDAVGLGGGRALLAVARPDEDGERRVKLVIAEV